MGMVDRGQGTHPRKLFVGRATERATIDALLGDAESGVAGALLLAGPAGIGKSALLQYAIDKARDFRVVRVTGVESEMAFDYAGVHQVVLPLIDCFGTAPRPPTRNARCRARQVGARSPRSVPRRPRRPEPRRRGRSCRASPRRHRRRPVARRRVGHGVVVRRSPTSRRTRRHARHHARLGRHPRPLRRPSPGSTSSGCPPQRLLNY